MMPQKQRRWSFATLKTLGMETFPIVLGVLLALALSQWNEDRVHRNQAQEAKARIVEEVAMNHRILAIIHENNAKILEEEGDQSSTLIPGLQLQETAWSTFLSSGVSAYVSYDELLGFSRLYSIMTIYKQFGLQLVENQMMVQALESVLVEDGRSVNATSDTTVELFLALEEQLLELLEDFLADVDTTAGKT